MINIWGFSGWRKEEFGFRARDVARRMRLYDHAATIIAHIFDAYPWFKTQVSTSPISATLGHWSLLFFPHE